MAETADVRTAETELSRLVKRAAAGEEIVITEGGGPKARLVPYRAEARARRPRNALGISYIAEDFDGSLPDHIRDAFAGNR